MSVITKRAGHGQRPGCQSVNVGYDGTASTGASVVIPLANMMRPQEHTPTFTSYGPGAANVQIEFTQSELNMTCVRPEQPAIGQYHWRTVAASMTADTPLRDSADQIPTAVRITFSGTSAASLNISFA